MVRLQREEDLASLPREGVAWVEVPLALAGRPELAEYPLDVLVVDPAAEAPHLYRLARLRDPALPRLTLPARKGLAQAAAVALSLHFPVRILAVQPDEGAIAELEETLDRFLHDPHAAEPVEPFQSALLRLLHGDGPDLWVVMEHERPDGRPEACLDCPVLDFCAGWFKSPDPSYDCAGVLRLFAGMEEAARSLGADLAEACERLP